MIKNATYYREMTIKARNVATKQKIFDNRELTLDEVIGKIMLCVEKGAKLGDNAILIGKPFNYRPKVYYSTDKHLRKNLVRLYDPVADTLKEDGFRINQVERSSKWGLCVDYIEIIW